MSKWLAAIGKGLSYGAGPFKPLVGFVLKLYDGHLAEEADKKLQAMMAENQDLALEVLQELSTIEDKMKGMKIGQTVLMKQLQNGTSAVLKLVRQGKLIHSSPEELEQAITEDLVTTNCDVFRQKGFVAPTTLEDECIYLYGDEIERFRRLVRRGGFNTSSLPNEVSGEVIISDCIQQMLKRYTPEQRANIIGALAEDSPASEILQIAHELLVLEPGNNENRSS